jgi:DNA adenine methylase
MRTTTNGMPRYNDKGEFNNSCHFSRPGIHPNRLRKICLEWSRLLNEKNVEFVCRSFEEVSDNEGDLTYIDAPYFSVKRNQMYFGGIDFSLLEKWIRTLKGKWIMSYDGKRGNVDYTVDIPQDLYVCHEYLKSGKSSFERYLGKGRTEEVVESLYLNYISEKEKAQTYSQGILF